MELASRFSSAGATFALTDEAINIQKARIDHITALAPEALDSLKELSDQFQADDQNILNVLTTTNGTAATLRGEFDAEQTLTLAARASEASTRAAADVSIVSRGI